jgi:acyl-CoA synthetase (AMP-forming)/AMP-acid ligase II
MATRQPTQAAVKIARGQKISGEIDYLTLSFSALEQEVEAWADKLRAAGVNRGDRVLVMVRQGLPLIAAAFGLFKIGAIPIIIDPGMGRKNFLACIARSRPRVLLGIPLAQITSYIFRTAFAAVEIRIWVRSSPTAQLASSQKINAPVTLAADCAATDLAAILFTSGSTGAPKGVCYEHGMFAAQVRLVRTTYGITPGEIDLPLLPIFALFNPALGMTTIVPAIDPRRPANIDPAKIVRAIQQEGVTNSFGSPTLWRIIARYCLKNNLTLPSIKRVLMAGAPVPPELFADLIKILPNGMAYSPYGATEALPVASISGLHVVTTTAEATAAGQGTCVGQPVHEVTIKIIAPSMTAIVSAAEICEMPVGAIGEIIVQGPIVTKTYDQLAAATALAKISPLKSAHGWPGGPWHRLGDAGYLDPHGQLWFCGRLAERVITPAGTLYTEQVEPIFNQHPAVARCALIGLGPNRDQPALVIEPTTQALVATQALRQKLLGELQIMGAAHAHTRSITRAYFHPQFPVDVRHNAKIHRLSLTQWAAHQPSYALGSPS